MKRLALSCLLLLIPISTQAQIQHWQIQMYSVTPPPPGGAGPPYIVMCPAGDGEAVEYYFRAIDPYSRNPLTGLSIEMWLWDPNGWVVFCPGGGTTSERVHATEEGNGYYRVSIRPAGAVPCTDNLPPQLGPYVFTIFEATGVGWVEQQGYGHVWPNSPDLSGDFSVNLTDTVKYADIYNTHLYSWCIDYDHSGPYGNQATYAPSNLSDTVIFSQHQGHRGCAGNLLENAPTLPSTWSSIKTLPIHR